MDFDNFKQLIAQDKNARNFYDSLDEKIKSALRTHGDGINSFEELKHFTDILKKRG